MKFNSVTPGIFYPDLTTAKAFFVDFIGFSILHEEPGLCVVVRDGVKFHLAIDEAEYAKNPAPLFRIETDDIQALWQELLAKDPDKKILHPRFPNGPELRPWNAWEFAAGFGEDRVCLVFQQWVTE
ncbi:VOC family protein [Cerasicoccus frondis]|uniref:VOC family protein n=1 Tax=Cerasicoccus frondis TaxID=490090 RepID=UPI002852B676|nr:VOC family protein [Cerasicoccus frondis]